MNDAEDCQRVDTTLPILFEYYDQSERYFRVEVAGYDTHLNIKHDYSPRFALCFGGGASN